MSFLCEVITPLFMSGSNVQTFELRPSEIKGMMRFWWRAVKALDDKEKLREEETDIFGGIKPTNLKSPVSIRIIQNLNDTSEQKAVKLGENIQGRINQRAGIKYLFYSTFSLKFAGERLVRKYLQPGTKFELILSCRDDDYEKFQKVLAAFWLTVNLGGLRTRSKRGAGDIRILQPKELKLREETLSFVKDDDNNVTKWIVDNFYVVRKIINGCKDFCSSYSNLSLSRFLISKESFNSWEDALDDLGKKYIDFRRKNSSKKPQIGVFGLPVNYRRTRITWKKVNDQNEDSDHDRRTSPLIFKVFRFGNKYRWMVLRMSGEFLPEGSVLNLSGRTQKPDFSLIDEFWNILKEHAVEDILSVPETLNKLAAEIKKELDARKVILFGSRARGDATKKSDIDIAVVTGKAVSNFEKIANVDLVNLNKVSNDLREKIIKEGIEL
ncbi:CRISPR-associated RAMP protein, Cmr1 family [Pseudothermotoga thermarum DSM 5069]|uniref:CRISPR-associated RAMP protein, Cmr1 family n=1 Tax=Pseudothermotoga thermarum DSM 5069 TaxID=688269 RepID=F7YTL8_9THEM|nr:CRISPR-associated RAMP protein, Cmr1 family [Pseudothermotoga thermarum DSM 5069]